MNATTERAALLRGVELYDELHGVVDDRTLEILDRRRRTAVVKRRGWLVRRFLLLADVVGLVAAFVFAEWLVMPSASLTAIDFLDEIYIFVASLPVWIVVTKIYGLYDRDEERTDHSTADDVVGVFHVVTVCVWLFFAFTYITRVAHPEPPKLLFFWLAAVVLITLGRAAGRAYCRRHISYLQNTIIVGAGEVGQLVARKILQHPEYGLNIVGFIDAEPKERRDDLGTLNVLGAPEKLVSLIRLFDVERVVIAFSKEPHENTLELIRSLRELDVRIDLVPRLYEIVGPNIGLHAIEGLPLVGLPPAKLSRSSRLLKRGMDIVGAIVGLIVTAPFFVYAAYRIKRESPGPVLFKQTRLGMDMREFTALKFRTLHLGTSDAAHREFIAATMSSSARPQKNGLYKLDRGADVTPFGRWLRRTSLDELPQLINVLRGEMSLVGPRPCIPYETESFQPHHFERFLVPPGITGLWQVTARARSTFGEALDMDVAYARNRSVGLDVWCLLRTPFQVFNGAKGTA